MDDALAFRNSMAEEGFEFTPSHAGKILSCVEDFRTQIDQFNPESMKNLDHHGKQLLRQRLAEAGTEVSFSELDDLINLCVLAKE